MVTSAAAMLFEAGKLRESTTRTSPPRVFFVGALAHIVDEHRSIGIQNGYASIAIEHNGPFICRVPMQFAEAATGKPHVNAGEVC